MGVWLGGELAPLEQEAGEELPVLGRFDCVSA